MFSRERNYFFKRKNRAAFVAGSVITVRLFVSEAGKLVNAAQVFVETRFVRVSRTISAENPSHES
jgi:hypothetical protein